MSDSESDIDFLQNNVLSFQSQGTTVWAKGPNVNSNISGLSFRTNPTSSNMAWNAIRPRYAESVYEPRNTSTFYNASSLQPQNFHNSYYPIGLSSQRSMYNGRSGSPVSVRSMGSNASFSVRDVESAVKTGIFSKFDMQLIKKAIDKRLKGRIRKRAARKRNRMLKGFGRRSGGESGEQASDSSSDDCMSVRTSKSTLYKDNVSSCRSTRTDLSYLRRSMKESNMFKDCTDNLRQNSFKTTFPAGPEELGDNVQPRWQNASLNTQRDRVRTGFVLPSQRFNQSTASSTIPENPEHLIRGQDKNNRLVNSGELQQRRSQDTDSDQDDIFTEAAKEKHVNDNRKREIEKENILLPAEKKRKLETPQKSTSKPTPNKTLNRSMQRLNDFIFAKPQLPVRRSNIVKAQPKSSQTKNKSMDKNQQQPLKNISIISQRNDLEPIANSLEQPGEKLISCSKQIAEKTLTSKPLTEKNTQARASPQKICQEKVASPQPEASQLSTTNMSMRPSFIKRKLFTQKVDSADKNSSSDSLQTESPQTNIYSKIQKEKNKARKLVTSQSCLSRDVLADDSNLLDLIHKVVPANQMNMTASTHRNEIQNNKKKESDADKLDITSMISMCNNSGDVSDTYTDEEIFNEEQTETEKKKTGKTKKKKSTENNPPPYETNDKSKEIKVIKKKNKEVQKKVTTNQTITSANQIQDTQQKMQGIYCNPSKVVLEKLPSKILPKPATLAPTACTENNGTSIRYKIKCVKAFWDTDAESDFEASPMKTSLVGATVNKSNTSVLNWVNGTNSNSDTNVKMSKTTKSNTEKNTVPLERNIELNSDIGNAINLESTTKQKSDIKIKLPAKATKTNTNKLPLPATSKSSDPSPVKTNITTQTTKKIPSTSKTEIESNKKQPISKANSNEKQVGKTNNTVSSTKTSKQNAQDQVKQTTKTKTNQNKIKTPAKTKQNSNDNNKLPAKLTRSNTSITVNSDSPNADTNTKVTKTMKPNTNKTKSPAKTKLQNGKIFKRIEESQKPNTRNKTLITSQGSKSSVRNKNNNTISGNKKTELFTVLDNTPRIRPIRKPRMNKCCDDFYRSDSSFNSSLEVMYRTLRSRNIDLSMSQRSDKSFTRKARRVT